MMGVQLDQPVQEADQQRCFAGSLAWLLYRAHWALASELTAALAPLGVSARGYHVLRAALSGEHTQTELAEMIGLDKTTMVVAVDELERAGLAERHPAPRAGAGLSGNSARPRFESGSRAAGRGWAAQGLGQAA